MSTDNQLIYRPGSNEWGFYNLQGEWIAPDFSLYDAHRRAQADVESIREESSPWTDLDDILNAFGGGQLFDDPRAGRIYRNDGTAYLCQRDDDRWYCITNRPTSERDDWYRTHRTDAELEEIQRCNELEEQESRSMDDRVDRPVGNVTRIWDGQEGFGFQVKLHPDFILDEDGTIRKVDDRSRERREMDSEYGTGEAEWRKRVENQPFTKSEWGEFAEAEDYFSSRFRAARNALRSTVDAFLRDRQLGEYDVARFDIRDLVPGMQYLSYMPGKRSPNEQFIGVESGGPWAVRGGLRWGDQIREPNLRTFREEAELASSILQQNRHSAIYPYGWFGPELEFGPSGKNCPCTGCRARFGNYIEWDGVGSDRAIRRAEKWLADHRENGGGTGEQSEPGEQATDGFDEWRARAARFGYRDGFVDEHIEWHTKQGDTRCDCSDGPPERTFCRHEECLGLTFCQY